MQISIVLIFFLAFFAARGIYEFLADKAISIKSNPLRFNRLSNFLKVVITKISDNALVRRLPEYNRVVAGISMHMEVKKLAAQERSVHQLAFTDIPDDCRNAFEAVYQVIKQIMFSNPKSIESLQQSLESAGWIESKQIRPKRTQRRFDLYYWITEENSNGLNKYSCKDWRETARTKYRARYQMGYLSVSPGHKIFAFTHPDMPEALIILEGCIKMGAQISSNYRLLAMLSEQTSTAVREIVNESPIFESINDARQRGELVNWKQSKSHDSFSATGARRTGHRDSFSLDFMARIEPQSVVDIARNAGFPITPVSLNMRTSQINM